MLHVVLLIFVIFAIAPMAIGAAILVLALPFLAVGLVIKKLRRGGSPSRAGHNPREDRDTALFWTKGSSQILNMTMSVAAATRVLSERVRGFLRSYLCRPKARRETRNHRHGRRFRLKSTT